MQAEEIVAREPLRDASWVPLMRALYFSGRPAEALRLYEAVRSLLARELGSDPGPGLRETQLAILRHDAEALRPPASRPALLSAAHAPHHGHTSGTLHPLVGRDDELAEPGRLRSYGLGSALRRTRRGKDAPGSGTGGPGRRLRPWKWCTGFRLMRGFPRRRGEGPDR
ncbi:hypothetical protein JBE04_02140 [Streptomyces sp. PRKS01-29]|nr:hypothetical protein [Streptomyces sabulosicollis]